ncbi:MAG: hemerythrin domain-containing protein [Actinomycetota bacterium]
MTSVLIRQKRDHAELDRLLHAIDAASGADRQELLTQLCRLVFPHAFAEESVLWPVVRRVLPDGAELTLQIEQEHQQINELFTELEKSPPDSPRHRELWPRIVALLREDVRDEEDVLFPKLQAALSERRLSALGMAWEVVRRSAPTRPHPVVARRPPGNVLAAAPLTAIDRVRDRLDRVARAGSGAPTSLATRLSAGLAGVAGLIEHVPPLTRGEDPSTRTSR